MGTGVETKTFAEEIRETFLLSGQDIRTYSPLTLAYIGDAVYELIIRTMLVEEKNAPVNRLHHEASSFVKAGAQADAYFRIRDELTEEELSVFKRGRNAKSYTSAKNASITDYRTATGVEALYGYWYLTGQTSRMLEMAKLGFTENKLAVGDRENIAGERTTAEDGESEETK